LINQFVFDTSDAFAIAFMVQPFGTPSHYKVAIYRTLSW